MIVVSVEACILQGCAHNFRLIMGLDINNRRSLMLSEEGL